MFKSMSSDEHFSKRGSGPAAAASIEVGSDRSASSWISMLSAVSRPAWSLLQKYFPARPQAGKPSIDFGHTLMAGLDNLMPSDQSSTHLRVAYVHCQHENGGFLTSGDAEPLSWLTADSLRDLGIQDRVNMTFKAHQTAPVEYRYFALARKFFSQVLSPREAKNSEPKFGIWYSNPASSSSNTWWWQGLWRSDDLQNPLDALYQTKTTADAETKSPHCNEHLMCEPDSQRSPVSSDRPLGPSSETEWACGECAGPSRFRESADHASLHTARLEFLPNPLAHEHSIEEHLVGARAAAACSEVAVLTPDQDNGYSSLEEESANGRQCNMNAVCELLGVESSAASQGGDHGHGGEEDKSAGNTHCIERVQNKEDEKEEEEEKEQNNEPEVVPEVVPVQSIPHCQNKAIAYIMGTPCSDESDVDDNSGDSDEDDDDGFDSDDLDNYSDSDDLDDSDDEDEEDEEDSESDELDSESERLWNSMCQTRDPYNPRNFTAPIHTSQKPGASVVNASPVGSPVEPDSFLCSSPSFSPSPLGGTLNDIESSEEACSSMDEAESLKLWNSFSCSSDPYSPMNFKASVRTRPPARQRCKKGKPVEPLLYSKEEAEERMDSGFSETTSVHGLGSAGAVRLKKVTFIEEVEEFYASSDEERRGPWEEYARDRCRFQRRVQEVEESISYCLSPSFRLNILQRLYPTS